MFKGESMAGVENNPEGPSVPAVVSRWPYHSLDHWALGALVSLGELGTGSFHPIRTWTERAVEEGRALWFSFLGGC